jgi:sterol desaturase/sphingolipid hydroxylase (fatty acid hydroxylase superfamily)
MELATATLNPPVDRVTRRPWRRVFAVIVTISAVGVGIAESPRLLVGFSICAVLFLSLEALVPLVKRPLRRDWHVDVVHVFANRLPVTVAVSAALGVIGPPLHNIFPESARTAIMALPEWLLFVILLILADFMNYLAHRALHEIPFLWRLHSVHHSSANLDWLSTSRGHPLDQITNVVIIAIPFAILDLNITFYAIFVAFQFYYPFLAHANSRITLRPLSGVFVTPLFHHWHHANEPEAINRNYGTVFSIWDTIFRTRYLPDRSPLSYGINEAMPGSWLGQMAAPFLPRTRPSSPAE